MTPRLMTRREAAEHCRLSVASFHRWVVAERLPGPLPGTKRWDSRALDLALANAEPSKGQVYVAGFSVYVKIGWTSGIGAVRVSKVEQGVPEPLTIYAIHPHAGTEVETALKKRFEPYNTRGEWFRLEGEVAKWVSEGCPL